MSAVSIRDAFQPKGRYTPTALCALEVYMIVKDHIDSRFDVQHDNEMLALAEAISSPEEVIALIRPRVERAFRRAKKTHSTVAEARRNMWGAANSFLHSHFYVLPGKDRIVNDWCTVLLKRYQKWWRRVEKERKRITRRNEKLNLFGGNARREAMDLISPELFADMKS